MNTNKENHSIKWKLACGLLCFLYLVSRATPAISSNNSEQQKQLIYIALGDSLTAGLGSSETDYLRLHAFVPLLTNYLRQNYGVYVENHGIPGLTSKQLLNYVEEGLGVKQKIAEADLITITIGGNDLLQLITGTHDVQVNDIYIEKVISQANQNLLECIRLIRTQNQKASIHILELYSPYADHHPLQEISQKAVSLFNYQLEALIEKNERVYHVNVYDLFLNQEKMLTHISQDDIHPNDQGYELIFDAFRKSIVQ